MAGSTKDLIISVAILLLALGAMYVIQVTPSAGASRTDAMTFSTLPVIYASCLGVLSLILGISSVTKLLRERGQEKEVASWDWLLVFRLIATLVLICFYAFALQHIHFAIASFAFLLLSLILYGRGPFWKIATVSLIGAAVFYSVFIKIIQIPI